MKPTLEEVKDAAAMQGVSEGLAEDFYNHYESQGWKRGNGLEISNWRTLLTLWLRDVYGIKEKANKNKGVKKPYEKPLLTCWCGKKGRDFNIVGGEAFCCTKHRKERLGW